MNVKIHKFIDGTVHVPNCGNQMRTWCSATCHSNSRFSRLMQEAKNSHSDSETYKHRFYLFLWASIVSWVGMAVVVSIADAICFDLLGLYYAVALEQVTLTSNYLSLLHVTCTLGYERRKDYGKQKMWGSIGFGIFGISAGYLVDVFSEGQSEKNYNCIFYIMLIMMIFDFIVSMTLKKVYRILK